MRRQARAPSSEGARRSGPGAWRPGASARVDPRAVAALLTTLLHLVILIALLRVPVRVVAPLPPTLQLASADRLRDAGERIVGVDIRPGLSTGAFACAGSRYIGIGITSDPRTQRILMVGDDTPASRAGLQHDDIVLNPEAWRDAHREGFLLRLRVLREGVKTIVPVRVGWICIG